MKQDIYAAMLERMRQGNVHLRTAGKRPEIAADFSHIEARTFAYWEALQLGTSALIVEGDGSIRLLPPDRMYVGLDLADGQDRTAYACGECDRAIEIGCYCEVCAKEGDKPAANE